MSKEIRESLHEKLFECQKHAEKILISKEYLKKYFPLTLDKYNQLDDIANSFIDQLIYRFSKLQDTLGTGVFSRILEFFLEDVKAMTFIDKLNRLEELNIVNKNQWLVLREVRNELAHEYSYNKEEIIEGIIKVYNMSESLLGIYHHIKNLPLLSP